MFVGGVFNINVFIVKEIFKFSAPVVCVAVAPEGALAVCVRASYEATFGVICVFHNFAQ